jgi:hypothetical protein
MSARRKIYARPPFAPAYMLPAFRPSRGWRTERGCPDLHLQWNGYRIERDAAESLRALCGLRGDAGSTRLDLLYPQVTGFRLIMAMLTCADWPLPIWNALQIRNRLVLHGPLRADDGYVLDLRPSGWRVLAKGVEIDLHMTLAAKGELRWESVVTFYYRGRYGSEAASGQELGAVANAPAITSPGSETGGGAARDIELATWNVGDGHRWAFGRLTGDFNGLHEWNAYARRMGFPAAFPHPQRILGQCLARLPDPGPVPLTLDLWIKGPVFFGRDVALVRQPSASAGGGAFGLWLEGESRPALVGTLGAATAALGRPAA